MGGINSKSMKNIQNHQLIHCDDVDQEFLQMADHNDMGVQDSLDQLLENFDDVAFDSFQIEQILSELSLPFIINKIFHRYDFLESFYISNETLFNFSKEITHGYFKENKYHNATHIIDSLQAMHYLMYTGNLQSQMKKIDVFSVFISNIIHDYEHPGYSNSFIVRTKHPLAIRYSDQAVLENHHLASAFHIILKNESCNIL